LQVDSEGFVSQPVWDTHGQQVEKPSLVFSEGGKSLTWDQKTNAIGIEWEQVPFVARPKFGVEIVNAALSEELKKTRSFSINDFEKFGVGCMQHNSYIKSGNAYFRPVDTAPGPLMGQKQAGPSVEERFKELQKRTFKISYLIQHLQNETNVLFFLASGLAPHDKKDGEGEPARDATESGHGKADDRDPDVPAYWDAIGREMHAWAVPQSWMGEIMVLAMYFAFAFLPGLLLYFWVQNNFYASLREKGLAVYGKRSDCTSSWF
jgi:hypothetical protein